MWVSRKPGTGGGSGTPGDSQCMSYPGAKERERERESLSLSLAKGRPTPSEARPRAAPGPAGVRVRAAPGDLPYKLTKLVPLLGLRFGFGFVLGLGVRVGVRVGFESGGCGRDTLGTCSPPSPKG